MGSDGKWCDVENGKTWVKKWVMQCKLATCGQIKIFMSQLYD